MIKKIKLSKCVCCDKKAEVKKATTGIYKDYHFVVCDECFIGTGYFQNEKNARFCWNEHQDKIRKLIKDTELNRRIK